MRGIVADVPSMGFLLKTPLITLPPPPPFPTNTPSTPQYTTPFKQNTTKISVSIIIFTLVVTYIWIIIETSHLNMKKHRIYMHTVSQLASCPSVDFQGLEDWVRYPKEEAAGKKARTPFWSDLFPLPPHKENGRVILSLHLTLSHQRPPPSPYFQRDIGGAATKTDPEEVWIDAVGQLCLSANHGTDFIMHIFLALS